MDDLDLAARPHLSEDTLLIDPLEDPADARELALAVSVLFDMDLTPTEDGVVLDGEPSVTVPWVEVRRALAGDDPHSAGGRSLVAERLRWHRLLADTSAHELAARLRPVGVPTDADDHPGLDWVCSRVLGDALDLGPGFAGLDPQRPDVIVVVPAQVLLLRGVDVSRHWPAALDLLEAMGALAADRFRRDPAQPLRPMGDCDVVTLLASRALRAALAEGAAGLRPLAVPLRTRGWVDLRRVDPAYTAAAAAAAPEGDQGFRRPLLVTAEEVQLARPGGRPSVLELLDPAPTSARWRTDSSTLSPPHPGEA